MALTSPPLASLRSTGFIADGGLETSLIFLQGIDLPCFAAFPLLDDEAGRTALAEYYAPYLVLAADRGLGLMLDTPTWRANPDWAALVGYDRDALDRINRESVGFMRGLADELDGHPVVLNGAIGPRGDGYVVGSTMSANEAANYHALQVRALADAGVDLITATTMNYVEEALGVAHACEDAGVPFVVGFTVETDGRLPSGQPLRSAIEQVDAETAPEYFMVNCAHPTHFSHVLDDDGAWLSRIAAIRANASTMSHAELDEADELDRGDIPGLLGEYVALRSVLPELRVVGGCCGTDHEHIAAISRALLTEG
ncbi:MAG: homocysteine S-methyltransferase family protein [Ilumatobacter fluminis]|uniref:homocysteine S-methyltransferase family protein n=1 Tax=Ilumatobacter fluminis TaxID=467091 RepID=UPI0032EEABD6